MERLQELKFTSWTLDETRNFPPKLSKKSPQDDAFNQAKVDLQEILKLGANLEVKWSKIKQDEVKLSSLLFLCCSADQERGEREGFVLWIFPWKLEEFVAKSFAKVNYE